jgi:translocator protein
MSTSSILALLGFLVLCLGVGGFSGFFTAGGVRGWYQGLRKPAFNPPNWILGPVWTLLYIMMAFAAWRVWRSGGDTTLALVLFAVQLALNFAWSFIFFNAHRIGLALADIIVLWLAIAATIVAFAPLDSFAAWLLVPYLAWVSFATLLNASIWRLNPGLRHH